ELAALPNLELDVVDDRADRDVAQRQRVARLDVGPLRGDDGVAGGETLRREDVGELAVLVLDQRNESRAVRVVFEPLYRRRHVHLAPLEVDDAIGLLVTAAAEARGDAPVVVAAAGRILPLGQRLDRRALVQ